MRQKSKLVEVLKGKGFYIILILCVAAVGVSGYVLFFSAPALETEIPYLQLPATPLFSSKPSENPFMADLPAETWSEPENAAPQNSPAPEIAPLEITPPEKSAVGETSDLPSENKPLGTAESVSGGAEIAELPQSKPVASYYVWPVTGEVISRFSVDELVFNSTMQDWRVHTGVDIAASVGSLVSSIGAGYVEDVYFDEMMGTTVVINHGNETRSVYKNLMESANVAIGDDVEAGQTIAAVGKTADAEYSDAPHLHFEVIRAGAQIDPLSLLP